MGDGYRDSSVPHMRGIALSPPILAFIARLLLAPDWGQRGFVLGAQKEG